MKNLRKEEIYKTATAKISCQHFNAGEIVSVKHIYLDENGVDWFFCNGVVAYPKIIWKTLCCSAVTNPYGVDVIKQGKFE